METSCDNCEVRKAFAKALDMHWLGQDDCPLDCDVWNADHIVEVTEMATEEE